MKKRDGSTRPRPWAAFTALLLCGNSALMWMAFKSVDGARRAVAGDRSADPFVVGALDFALRLLAWEIILALASVAMSVWGLARGERLWAVAALCVAVHVLAARFAMM